VEPNGRKTLVLRDKPINIVRKKVSRTMRRERTGASYEGKGEETGERRRREKSQPDRQAMNSKTRVHLRNDFIISR